MRALFLSSAAFLLAATPVLAQQHDAHHASGKASTEHYTGWAELDAYHDVMARMWHPAKESRNLGPAREHAALLVERVAAWEKSEIPRACSTDGTKAAIAAVGRDSRAFAEAAKAENDEKLFAGIKELHDAFEKINRGCKIPTTK